MNLFHDTHDSVPVALVSGIAELELRTNRRASGKVAISERFIEGRHLRVRMSVRYLKTNLTVAWALFDHGGHIIKTRQQRLEPLLKGATPPNAVNEVIAVKTNFRCAIG